MISLKNILLAEESIHSKLLCNLEEDLSYILVLLNLLTIFYLVYSSYKKVTKITRIFGYFWSCFLMCANVIVLFYHTCIFTIMCTVFTGMAIIAVLSMIFEAKQEEKLAKAKAQKSEEEDETTLDNRAEGSYVVYKTTDEKYAFALHAKNKKLLLKSVYKYDSIEEAKKAILKCRDYGMLSELENSTGTWVLDVEHPKFRLYMENGNYYVDLAISDKETLLKSNLIEFYGDASWYAHAAMKCINTSVLYYAKGKNNILEGGEFKTVESETQPEEV